MGGRRCGGGCASAAMTWTPTTTSPSGCRGPSDTPVAAAQALAWARAAQPSPRLAAPQRRRASSRPGCNLVPALPRILVVWPDREKLFAAIPLETRHFEDLGRYLAEPMIERVRVASSTPVSCWLADGGWMVRSTALGGGVAQLLRTLLPYWKGAGIDVRWMVLRGSGEFFRVTKRFHNHLQGQPGDGDMLGIEELTTLDRAALHHARALASLVAPGDVVVLNDPQTAAMSVPLERAGATVIWSCHIGIDHDNEYSRNAWRCLRPRLTCVRRFVFSRYTSLPEWLGGAETSILTPGIDPGSTKNLPMPEGARPDDLAAPWPGRRGRAATPRYDCTDGSTATLAGRPTVLDSTGHRTGTGTPWWSRWPGGTASRTRSGSWTASWSGCWRRPARTCSWRAPTRARSPMTPRQKPCSPAFANAGGSCRPGARAGSCRLPPAHLA